MQIEFLGHAGLLITVANTRILCDPWISKNGAYHASWFQFPCNHFLMDRDYQDINAVVLSHEHLDHFDPNFITRKISTAVPIIVPRYPSRNLIEKISSSCPNPIIEVDSSTDYEFNNSGLKVLFSTMESSAYHDAAITFFTQDQVVINLNDAKLTHKQRELLKLRFPSGIDAVILQCSGASWYPICYRYPEERKAELCAEKRRAKLAYAFQTLQHFSPKIGLPYAGPAAFFQDSLQQFNDLDEQGIFPDQQQSADELKKRGYSGRLELPLPGDILNLNNAIVTMNENIRKEFSFAAKSSYLENYSSQMQSTINHELSLLTQPTQNLFNDFHDYFVKLGKQSSYFCKQIDMDIRFVISGAFGGDFLVRCHPEGIKVELTGNRTGHYTLYFEQVWLEQILHHGLAWEDFFLSLRFSADRNPDIYNSHLISWLKFADSQALAAIEKYECSRAKGGNFETIEVTAKSGRFRIAKYCPHAGASLEQALIEDDTITCLNHNYRFDLLTGKCLNGNCTLWTRKLEYIAETELENA